MYSIEVRTIARGTVHESTEGAVTESIAGHMYFVLTGNGKSESFGMTSTGEILTTDHETYKPLPAQLHSAVLSLSEPQYAAIREFALAAKNNGAFGPYNVLTNACIDFSWAALAQIGVFPNGDSGSDGDIIPWNNRSLVETALLLGAPNADPSTQVAPEEVAAGVGSGMRDNLQGAWAENSLFGLYGDDVLDGGGGADNLYGGSGNDWLGYTAAGLGNESVDEINSDGNVYDGGTGNDKIAGSVGADTYIFRNGDGFDYIQTYGGADQLNLMHLDTPESAVKFTRDGLDVLVTISSADGTVDQVRIARWFDVSDPSKDWTLDRVTLGAKTWWRDEIETLALTYEGTSGNDSAMGLATHSNTFIGNGGNDTLSGGAKSDTYVYTQGDGADTIIETGAGGDTVKLQGISSTTRRVVRSGNDLVVQVGGSMDSHIRVKDWFVSGAKVVEWWEFADRTMSAAELLADLETGQVGGDTNDALTVSGTTGQPVYGLGGDDTITGSSGDDWLVGGEGNDTLNGVGGQDVLLGEAGSDRLFGEAGDDWLYGGDGNDRLDGGAGADYLSGGSGDDILGGAWRTVDSGVGRTSMGSSVYLTGSVGNTYEGGTGNDTLQGTVMADLYLFNLGDGQDTLTELELAAAPSGQVDVLRFGGGIAPSDMQVLRSGTDLVLSHVNGTDKVTIKNWYGSVGSTVNQVERVEFADGTTWGASELTAWGLVVTGTAGSDTLTGVGTFQDTLHGGAGNDSLFGESGDDWLYGGDGNDRLDGGAGADYLSGGSGDDILGGAWRTVDSGVGRTSSGNSVYLTGSVGNTYEGGTGNDTLQGTVMADLYLFNLGDGQDTLTELELATAPSGQVDVLRFGEGIGPADIQISRSSNDLVLSHINGTDKVTVKNWFSGGAGATTYQVERIEFADGSYWSNQDVTSAVAAGATSVPGIPSSAPANMLFAVEPEAQTVSFEALLAAPVGYVEPVDSPELTPMTLDILRQLPPSIAFEVEPSVDSVGQPEAVFTGALTKYVTTYEPANSADFQLLAGPALSK